MNKNKKLGWIVLAAAFAIAILCLSGPVPAEPARGAVPFRAAADLVNPRPSQDDGTSDDADDSSGDATPVPEPPPPELASV